MRTIPRLTNQMAYQGSRKRARMGDTLDGSLDSSTDISSTDNSSGFTDTLSSIGSSIATGASNVLASPAGQAGVSSLFSDLAVKLGISSPTPVYVGGVPIRQGMSTRTMLLLGGGALALLLLMNRK